jgi:lipopolysaccharide/colanic/teichoic acid biosynthesis glycosyltransferase
MKRLLDIFIAAIYLLVSAPLFLVVALAIKLESPGPVFFRQIRLGRYGAPFKYLKFRTMVMDAEQSPTGPIFELRADPRISRVGRFLRITSIDELPALLNVLRGDMSLVGPRAALPLEAAHYSEMQRRRLELKPGLTGYWQAYGSKADRTDFQRMIEMDLEYSDKQSLMLDLKILLRTIVIVLKSEAAY